MSNILSHGLTVPTNPVQPQPAPTYSAPLVSSLNDAFAPTVSAMESYYDNKLYEQDADFMESRAFDDDVPDPSYARRSLRTSGLIAYVTSDLSTARAKQARDTFGHTSPYRQDKHTGMLVGRALCANLGYPGDPVTFIRNHGKDTLGLVMPQTGYSTAQELYSLIGTTFATQQRNAYTKALQAEQARATAAEETRQRVLPGAITRAVTGSSITPEEDAVLKSCGISETSLAKVRLLTGLKGLATVSPTSGAQQTAANPLNNLSLLGIENNPALKSFSLFDREGLYKASRIIGNDQTARAIYLNLMLIAGRNQRDSHHSDNFLANFAASTANLIGDVSRAISETAIEPGMNAGFGLASLVYDDAGVTQYKALVAEAADAFEKGYKQRSAELNQEYGSSIGSRILWNLADFPTTIAEPVANTAPFTNLPTAVLAVAQKAVEEQQTAAANAKGDPNAGIMQLGIVPTARAAIFGASVYGTGWATGKALGALSKTSIGRSVAARVAISPKVRYTANVTEGITTEAIEEFVDAAGQEALEFTGLVEERQKRENWSNFCKLMQDREFWTADVAMNLVFGAFGYKGSRSKSPYKDVLKELGFTQKEQQRLELELVKAQMQGATNSTLGDMVMESVRAKQAANPQLFKERATAMVANAQQKQAIQEAAANGVLKHVLKKSGASNMQKNEDGTYNIQSVTHGEDGKFELKEERFTEQQLQDWLASDVNRTVTSEILYIQSLVRGEQVSRAAESAATTPFSRVVSMLNAPAELLTKLDGQTSFDEETLTLFSEYAINEINLRMAQGETAEQARAAEFGTTGTTLGTIANLASDFDTRVSHAIATGELQPGQIPQSNAYILPGKTPGDNILMLARGEASAKDVAHDWLEGFARSRYLSNRSYWQQALDALDTDLRSSGIISKSLFSKPQADRTDLEYIEVFSHLAEADFLANHDAVTLSDNSHGILDEVLDDLGAVQGGLELTSALSQYLTSDAAKNAVGAALDPLRGILRDAGAALTDLLTAAEASSPKSAADFIIASQQNIDEDVRIRLADLAKAADSPPTTKTDTPKPTDTALPPEATDGLNVTVADLAKLNGLNADGTRPAPIGATYSRIDPKKNGLSLIGGIAHGLPDGSISGSAKLANITIHPTIRSIDPARLRTNADEKEVILFRKKDGTLQAIGGLSFLQHATTCGVENVPVRVFPSGKKYTPQWAAKTAAESLIRANLATTAQTLSYLTKHALTRDAARRSNLIPKDTNGQELPTSRAAWLLHQHATKKTIADTISGRLSTAAALATIQDKAAALLKAAQQPSLPGFETSSFSLTAKQAAYTPEMLAIKEAAEKDGTFMKAPNGKPTNLTEHQWLQVRTPAFKNWFGDWESLAYKNHFRKRLLDLLTPELLQKAKEKGYHGFQKTDIDKRVRPMAYIPLEIAKLMGTNVIDNLIYTSDFRFIEHVANHHPEVTNNESYVDSLLEAFANPTKVYFDTRTKGYIFLKDEQSYFLSIADAPGEGQRYIQWKTAYSSHKLEGSRYQEIWNKNNRESVGADLHDKGPIHQESPAARLSVLDSKKNIKEIVKNVKSENISKVVDENGEPLVVYHGTPTGGFTVFRDESYFSPHQWYAERYQHPSASSNRSSRDVGVPMMYEVFLNIRKPFDTRNAAESEIFESEFFRKWGNGAPLSERGLPDWTDATDLLEFIEENEYNYDGLILDEGGTPDGKGGVTLRGHSFVPVTPNQIKSATANRGTFDANNPDITFSISPARARRKYMPLSEAVKLEQYIAMESYARKLYRDAISLAQANPKNKLDDAVRAAMHLRALLNAVFSTLPKEAQPWKALGHARKQIDSLTWAVSHSYANLDPHQAPGISPAEIEKYNESGYRDRRQWLANKLSRLIVSVADSSARAIEAHACRTLLDTAEATVKTLKPKYQKSGKERRGTTAADVYNKAVDFFKMFDWGVDKRAQELTAVSDTLNRQDLTDAERTEAEKRRQAILTFAGLRRESLPRVKTGVETLLAYIQTGRLAWEQKLLEERRATEAIQEAIAALEPRIEHSTTTAKEDKKRGWFANFFTSLQNPIQTLNQLANLPGKVGSIFADIRTRLAMAEDAKTYALQQARQDAAAALDAILGCTGEPSLMRQIKRASFLSDANERINTGIRKPGRIKITTFEFTQQDIINLQQIRKEKGEEAFRLAIDTHRRKYSKEDALANTIPYEEVFQDALAQMQDPSYRGGTIYVERYGERDIAHEDTLILTRLQAANLWLLAQQPSYANKYDQNGNLIERGMLDILGYTEKVISDLEAFIGPELRAYAIWKREYLNTTGLFEAYEQHMGLPFPKEENYWPGAFDNASNNAGLDALQTAYAGNGVYNMLIIRKKHLSEPNLSVDMEAAWEHAIQQHYHYIHLSPLTRQLRAITRDSDTRQRLRKIVGNATLDNLETQVNTLDGAPAQQLQAGAHANHLLGRWLRAFAKALLNMATGTTVKQVSAAAHALAHPGINLLNILPKLIKATLSDITGITLTPGHKTPREIRQLKAFRVRFNREDLSTIASGLTPGETISKIAIVDLFGSRFLEYTDAWSNSQAMAAVYNTEYDRAKAIMLTANEGKPLTPEQQQQLEEHCEKTVSVILKQTAQPLEREDKAALVQQRNWAASQNFFMMGEIISKLGCTVSLIKAGFAKAYGLPPEKASKLRRKAWLKGLTFYSGMGMASQAVLAALSYAIGSAPDSDDEDFLDWVIGNIVAGAMGFSYLNALPVIGESVAAIAQAATGKHGVFATYATTGVGITYKDMQDLFKILNPDKTTEERIYAGSNWLRLLTTLTGGLAVSKGATFVSELFSAANNINNAVRPALQRAKNTAKKEQKDRKALNRLKKQIKTQGTQKRYTQLR